MPGDHLEISLSSRPERVELRLSGEVTLQTVSELGARLTEAEARHPPTVQLRGLHVATVV